MAQAAENIKITHVYKASRHTACRTVISRSRLKDTGQPDFKKISPEFESGCFSVCDH